LEDDVDYFKGLIGQAALKRKLSFYLDAFKETRRMPFLLFIGGKGSGKTHFAKRLSANLLDKKSVKRPLLEINCSIIRNNQMFFETLFLQFLNDKNITVLFDECHNLPKDLAQALLTICNSDPDAIRDFQWQESVYRFDFTRLTFLFATTEQDKIFPPLKDRMEIVDFEAYKQEELKQIVEMHSGDTVYEGGILDDISKCLRGNARSCVKMAENISTYRQKVGNPFFGRANWKELCHALNILPMGLNNSEVMILHELNERGACSLNMLASATGLSRTAIISDVEQHLLRNALIKIDGKRKITERGQKILQRILA